MTASGSRDLIPDGRTHVHERLTRLVLDLLGENKGRTWRGVDIALSLEWDDRLALFIVLAELARDGRLENPAPGRYRWPTASEIVTAECTQRRLAGN